MESGDESDDKSIMPPLLSEEDMNAMEYGDQSDHDILYTEMLEDICDGSQTHPNINRREHVIKYVMVLSKDNWNGKEH